MTFYGWGRGMTQKSGRGCQRTGKPCAFTDIENEMATSQRTQAVSRSWKGSPAISQQRVPDVNTTTEWTALVLEANSPLSHPTSA
jgi:hypothetical protein